MKTWRFISKYILTLLTQKTEYNEIRAWFGGLVCQEMYQAYSTAQRAHTGPTLGLYVKNSSYKSGKNAPQSHAVRVLLPHGHLLICTTKQI